MTDQRRVLVVALGIALALLLTSVVLGIRLATLPSGAHWGPTDDRWQDRGRGPRMGSQEDAPAVVDEAQARRLAAQWLTANRPGAQLGEAQRMGHGYAFDVTADRGTIGLIMVDDRTGRVFPHGWTRSSPTPSPST